MAQRCDICGKGPQFGNRVSHAHNVTHRRFNPNLQSVRALVGKGTHKTVKACTRCLRSGKVTKPAKLHTGFEVAVPLFVNTGDRIEVDTRTGEYKRRV